LIYYYVGIDGISLDMQNIVDITSERNVEIAVRIHTDVQNNDGEFYTDLNGFMVRLSPLFVKKIQIIFPVFGKERNTNYLPYFWIRKCTFILL
jgi:hypothetical protein